MCTSTQLSRRRCQSLSERSAQRKVNRSRHRGHRIQFLESCFAAGLLNQWPRSRFTLIARRIPRTVASEYSLLRETIDRYRTARGSERVIDGARTPDVISGEWGYSSAWREMSEQKQAYAGASISYQRREWNSALDLVRLARRWIGQNEAEHHFGLMRYRSKRSTEAWEGKPAYLAAKTLIANLRGFIFQETPDRW